jgi:hypothetical protein
MPQCIDIRMPLHSNSPSLNGCVSYKILMRLA